METIEQFLARGGKIQKVDDKASAFDESLKRCKCGCKGNYTDHQMRQAENEHGAYSSYYGEK